MKQDKETRKMLLESARTEFMEKGYMKASLRNICRNAGVTTGALYFFFEDKEALFEALAGDAVKSIYDMMANHFREESEMLEQGDLHALPQDDVQPHMDEAYVMIHQMYLRREDILLALTKGQGTKYENIADLFIETAEKHYRMIARGMQLKYPDAVIADSFIHWMAHEQIDAFIYMITHIEDEKQAIAFISQVVTYMMAGWFGLFRN